MRYEDLSPVQSHLLEALKEGGGELDSAALREHQLLWMSRGVKITAFQAELAVLAERGFIELHRDPERLVLTPRGFGHAFDHPTQVSMEVMGGDSEDHTAQSGAPRSPGKAGRDAGAAGSYGPYRLGRKLGEGGFGAVYEADQDHPVKRRVALKLIKLGMDTREVIARFEVERQALAMMDHPNIARVLDVGATEAGRPYFVMELVQGEPISAYCERHSLTTRERLQLFDQVCSAVQHAHTKGVIHRDLKPSNVLVGTQEDQPQVKVIDFGIAKATRGHLTDQEGLTRQHQMIGTPVYMSPEQAEGSADIDTRTDIYSLGILLYQLLTDTTPFESTSLRNSNFADIKRIIQGVEAPRPSARLLQSGPTLDGIAARRRVDPEKLVRLVRGELDWIVMKAIEKDRRRRYETVNGLAMDVRRHLAGEPVLAAPPSASYRLRKFAWHYRSAVAVTALVASALLVGITGFAWQARIARNRADELEQVAGFQADMLKQIDPTRAGKFLTEKVRGKFTDALVKSGVPEPERAGRVAAFTAQWQNVNATDTARDLIEHTILRPAVEAIDQQFRNQPKVDATLRQVLSERYVGMGLYPAAFPLQERALATRRRVLGDAHPDTLRSIASMGLLLKRQGKLIEAEPYYREALKQRRKVLGENHADTLASLDDMGVILREQGKFKEALPYYLEALEKDRRLRGPDDPNTITALNNIGTLLQSEGKLPEAEPYLREALERQRRLFGGEHPDTLIMISNLGWQLQAEGRLAEAGACYREVLEKSRRVQGEDHPDTLLATTDVGRLLEAQGKLNEAAPYFQEVMDKSRRILGFEHPDTLMAILDLGRLRCAQGKFAETVQLLAPAEASTRKVFRNSNARRLAQLLMFLGKAHAGLHEFPLAKTELLEAHAIYVDPSIPKSKEILACRKAIVDLFAAWNAAQPGKGYDAQRNAWTRKLGEPQP